MFRIRRAAHSPRTAAEACLAVARPLYRSYLAAEDAERHYAEAVAAAEADAPTWRTAREAADACARAARLAAEAAEACDRLGILGADLAEAEGREVARGAIACGRPECEVVCGLAPAARTSRTHAEYAGRLAEAAEVAAERAGAREYVAAMHGGAK